MVNGIMLLLNHQQSEKIANPGNPAILHNSSGLVIRSQTSLLPLELVWLLGTALQTRALSGIV